MKRILEGLFVVIWCVIVVAACTDPTFVGEELLEGDKVQPGFTDTVSIRTYTSSIDSFRTYTSTFSGQLEKYFVGDFLDPILGRTKATTVIQTRMQRDPTFFTLIPPSFPVGPIVDSIVLVLPYDADNFYGNLNQIYTFEVLELQEGFAREDDYYSNTPVPATAEQLAVHSFRPSLNDSLSVINYTFGVPDTVSFSHLRVHLPIRLGQKLVNLDSISISSDSAYLSVFPGLVLAPISQNDGIVSFNLSPVVGESRGGVYVYYRDQGTDEKNQYQFGFNEFAGRYVNFERDFSGSVAEAYIGPGKGDSLLFLKGNLGTEVRVEFPYITNLKGLIVNEALLEIALVDLPGSPPGEFEPIEQLTLSRKRADGSIVLIDDFLFAPSNLIGLSFGGDLEEGVNGEAGLYTMNISTHLQRMIDGDEVNELIMSVFRRGDNPHRSVLAGAKHPTFPVKLKITFTKP
ncbi:MAG: DUF4270 family protein [Saprospiraceae bacterium]